MYTVKYEKDGEVHTYTSTRLLSVAKSAAMYLMNRQGADKAWVLKENGETIFIWTQHGVSDYSKLEDYVADLLKP